MSPAIDVIKLRGGTAAQWVTANPVLGFREPGIETDTGLTKYGDGLTAWSGLAYSYDAAGTVAVETTRATTAEAKRPPMALVSDLTYPLAIAHRGGGNLFPENSLEAYESVCNLPGIQAVEAGDMQVLTDGGLMAMHDATVDRTTSGTGNVNAYSTPGAKLLTMDPSTWFLNTWPNTHVPMFADILDRVGGKVVIVPEAKQTGTATTSAIINAVTKRGLQKSILFQSFSLPDCAQAAAAGLGGALLLMNNGTESTPSAVAAAGCSHVSISSGAANLSTVIASFHAVGVKVILFTVDTQGDYDAALAAGADGVFTNEPLYAPRNYAYRTTVAPWTTDGTYGHGMHGGSTVSGPWNGRAVMVGGPGAWRLQPGANNTIEAGPFCPLPTPTTPYTITWPLAFDIPPSSDTSKWGGINFCTIDDQNLGTAAVSGYELLLRWTGQFQFWAAPLGGGAYVSKGTFPSTAPFSLTLSAGLVSGTPITSLPVTATPAAVKKGHQFALPTGQIATASAAASLGATAVTVTSITPNSTVTTGSVLPMQALITITRGATTITCVRLDDSAAITSSALTSGVPVTSIPITALPASIPTSSPAARLWIPTLGITVALSAAATAGDTTLSVSSFTPAITVPTGTPLNPATLYTNSDWFGPYIQLRNSSDSGSVARTSIGAMTVA